VRWDSSGSWHSASNYRRSSVVDCCCLDSVDGDEERRRASWDLADLTDLADLIV
jgi:hypothetical protein